MRASPEWAETRERFRRAERSESEIARGRRRRCAQLLRQKHFHYPHSSLAEHDHCRCYDLLMAKRRKKFNILDLQLTGDARKGFTYFVLRDDLDTKTIKWELVAPNGDTLCSSRLF